MWGKDTVTLMEGAISLTPQIEANSSQEYYKYLRERTEKSPLSPSGNQFFPELQKEQQDYYRYMNGKLVLMLPPKEEK